MRATIVITMMALVGARTAAADAPTCDATEAFMVAGYPEYSTDVKDLAPEQQKLFKDLAQKIVDSHATSTPYVAFQIIGHADVALRKPVAERADFEQQVSERRASSARNTLLTEIMKRKGGDDVAKVVAFATSGEGSKHRIVKPTKAHPALTEAEMRMNRRVEIYIKKCTLRTPDPKDTLDTRISRLLTLVKAKGLPGAPAHRTNRAPCVLETLQKPNAIDVFVDGKATSGNGVGKFATISNEGIACYLPEWHGNYDTTSAPLPPTEEAKFLATITPILTSDGFAPSQSDDYVLSMLGLVMERIDLGMNEVDKYVTDNSMGALNPTKSVYSGDAIRKKLQAYYRSQLDDETNIYHCYK